MDRTQQPPRRRSNHPAGVAPLAHQRRTVWKSARLSTSQKFIPAEMATSLKLFVKQFEPLHLRERERESDGTGILFEEPINIIIIIKNPTP